VKDAQASSTAKVIAAATIALATDPTTAHLVSPGAATWCKVFLSSRPADRLLAKSAQHPLGRALWRRLEQLTLPGIVEHYWHRKRWIEARCHQAMSADAKRLLVLGAGLDTLGLRLALRHPQLEVVEVDHPATQAAKLQALHQAGHTAPTNLRFLACDLAHQAMPALAASPAPKTLTIAEGVLMYLQPDRVHALFDSVASSGAPGSEFIFSFMSLWPDGGHGFRPRSALIERWLAWRGEPFMWAWPPEGMPELLASHGLQMQELAQTADFTPRTATAPGLQTRAGNPLRGENLVRCTWGAPERAAWSQRLQHREA
jgi:methyltransferase (TIGR00027 family)